MRNEIIRQLLAEYEQQRARDAHEENRRMTEVTQKCPEIARLNDERSRMIFSSIRGILGQSATADDLPARMEAINGKISTLLEKYGYPRDYLAPVYRCAKCKDTGYVGDNVKEMCSCMSGELHRRLFERIGLKNTEEQSFETFDLNRFSDEKLPDRKYSQRTQMEWAFALCKEWADSYPSARTRDMLLMGKSGLGKTFLMNCIAKRLLERGQNVLMISAYKYIELARKAYFGNQPALLDSVLEADVLLLDDLGTEPLMENITVTQLFNLINERSNAGRGTIISTNLNAAELEKRYNERITSRLLDARNVTVVKLEGTDVRKPRGEWS